MKKNIGKVDKATRLILSVIGLIAFFIFEIPIIWSFIILATAIGLTVTVMMNWCPMCAMFGVSTCEISPKKSN